MEQAATLEAAHTAASNLIVVTGFGPFAGHEQVNASWEAVKLLPDNLQHNKTNYMLQKQLIPTEYAAVDAALPKLWQQKPMLVIHCGVHGQADCINVETNSCNYNFTKADFAGKLLENCTAVLCNNNNKENCKQQRLHCALNVNEIVSHAASNCSIEHINKLQQVLKVSDDVGTYLCAYIYLKSLDIDAQRTLFVHVPCINKPFSSAQTAHVLLCIIQAALLQLAN